MNDNNSIAQSNKIFFPWAICFMAMLFYCFNYFLRLSPSVMQSELTQTFHITATQFGTLAAYYYYAYAPMQLPAGIIFDKFGPRFVLFFASLIAVLGLAIFISADNLGLADTSRFLIGLGGAFSYIGTLKLASIWLPPTRFATVAGLTSALGMICGTLSQKYMTKLVETIGYKQALHTFLFIGVILSILILFIIRSPKQSKNATTDSSKTLVNLTQLGEALRIIFTNPQMWLIGIIGCLLYLPATVFLDLWGIPYLKSVYHLTSSEAVNISGITFLGWIIGGPIIGALSDKIKRRRMPLMLTGSIAATMLCIVFYVPGLTLRELYILFAITGFCCGAHPLCFALGKENNPTAIAGTAVAATNMLIMASGAIFPRVVGKLLDIHTTSPIGLNGVPIYLPADYTFALSIIPLGVALAIFLSFFLKETYCVSQAKKDDELVFASPELAPSSN